MNKQKTTDLTRKVGIPLFFSPESLEIEYGKEATYLKSWEKNLGGNSMSNDALWKSMKLAFGYVDENGGIINEPDLKKFWSRKFLYRGHQGAYWNDKGLLKLMEQSKIRPDVTALHAGTIAGEYIRTEGHEHLSGLPEIYETVYGKNGYLLFKSTIPRSEDIEDVFFVFAEAGDHVLFPPGYQHISVNIGEEGFLMTDWVSTEARTDFSYIKKHNGAPYWVVCKGNKVDFERNPKYKGKVPKIRKVKPVKVVELSHGIKIKKGEPMFNLVKDGKAYALDFLNDSSDKDFYKQAFIDF